MLVDIARLAADIVEPVSYASVTAIRAGAPTTVATSSEIALAVDLAQYTDATGPCLDALSGTPVDVPDIADVAAVMAWPGFRDTAWQLGLRASLSIPLFAASGAPVAALNLYAHHREPMATLTRHVWAAYHTTPHTDNDRLPSLPAGSQQLLTGITAAFHVRDLIQQALGVIMARQQVTARTAYLILRTTAA